MYKPEYGDPVVTLRLPRQMITAAKISARRHDTTVSGLVRSLLVTQFDQDGINWCALSKPTPGQKTIDDYIDDGDTNA